MFNIRWPFIRRKEYDEQAERYNKRIEDMLSIVGNARSDLRLKQFELDRLAERGLNILVGPEYGNNSKDDIKVNVSASVSRGLAIDALAAPDALLKRVCSETGNMVSFELFKYIKTSL